MGRLRTKALIDTGAFSSAISLEDFEKLKNMRNSPASQIVTLRNESVKVANGTPARMLYRAKIKFCFAGKDFYETFVVIENLNSPILGIPFFENNGIIIDLAKKRLQCPDITVQLNELQKKDGTTLKLTEKKVFSVITASKIDIEPNQQSIILCKLDKDDEGESNLVGVIEPSITFENRTELCVTSSLSKMNEKGFFPIGVINLSASKCTIPPRTLVGKLKLLTPEQIEFLAPIDPSVLEVVKKHSTSKKDLDKNLSAIYNLHRPQGTTRQINFLGKSSINDRQFWFPTPETCSDPSKLNETEREIYEAILHMRQLEKINPERSDQDRADFLKNFNWKNSVLSDDDRSKVEALFVKYHHIFARHRLDIGQNDEFKVKLTPSHQRAVYTQSPPTPIHLRREILIELALMQYYGIVTTLPYSKYASPIFAQRKSSGNLRILIDLRRINHLIKHDYDSHNFPISSLADVGNHLAGKKYFSKLDCSQAFHVVKMADLESVQLLAFNFESRTYAFQRLAQGLNRSVSSFSSFMRKYLDPCIAADRCFQYVDDLGTASHTVPEMISYLEEILKCINHSGLKLSMSKCEIGVEKIAFLGNSITCQGISPNREKVMKF